jgi:hypothetical protein
MPWKPKKSILAMGALRVEHILHEHGTPEVLATVLRDKIRNVLELGPEIKHAASPIHIELGLPDWAPILEVECGITAYDIKCAKRLDQKPKLKRWLLRYGHKWWPMARIQLYEVLADLLNHETPLATYEDQVDPQLVPRMNDLYVAWETEVRRTPSIIRRSNAKGYDRDDPSQQYDGSSNGKDPLTFEDENTKPWLMPARIVTWPDRKHVVSFDALKGEWKAMWKQIHKEAKARLMHDWKVERTKAIAAKVKKQDLPPRPSLAYPSGKWFPYYVKSDLMAWMTNEKPVLAKQLRTMEPEVALERAKTELLEIIELMNARAHGDKRAEFKMKAKRRRWFGKIGAALDETELPRHLCVDYVHLDLDEHEDITLPVYDTRPWHELERFKYQLRRKYVNDVRTPKGMAWFPKAALPVEMQFDLDQLVMAKLAEKGRTPDFHHHECSARVKTTDGSYKSVNYIVAEPRWAIEAYYDIRLDVELEQERYEQSANPRCPTCHGFNQPRTKDALIKISKESPNITVYVGPKQAATPVCGAKRVCLVLEGEQGPERPGCTAKRKPGYAYCADHMDIEPTTLWPWS